MARRKIFVLSCIVFLAAGGLALAQGHPFAVGAREAAPGAASGIMSWALAQQAQFYRALTGAVRASAENSSAFWGLAGLSFAYGAFHAAGPGHGKAVVAAYMVANEQKLRRGLVITFLAALLQGAVAISIVGVAALVFRATSQRMTQAAFAIELASYAAVAALGAWLVWKKGGALARALWAKPALALAGAGGSRFVCESVGAGAREACLDCGQMHAPDPGRLGDRFSLATAATTVFAAGARPCSGAILVLVFAMAQGVFAAGVGAALAMSLGVALTTGALAAMAVLAKGFAVRFAGASEGAAALWLRAGELAAALAVLAFGLVLLAGAAGGRMAG